jgi:hypothetical protein
MKTTILLAAAVLTFAMSEALASGNGPNFTAVVNSDGSLARGQLASSSQRLGKGTYQVDFTQNITACEYTATIGLSGTAGSSDPGTVTLVGRSEDVTGLYVQTFNRKGKPEDLGFHVIVQC